MKLFVVPSSFGSMPPLHTWSGPIKRTMLTLATIMMLVTYVIFVSGIIAFLVVLAQWVR